jgi:hypothetical protein
MPTKHHHSQRRARKKREGGAVPASQEWGSIARAPPTPSSQLGDWPSLWGETSTQLLAVMALQAITRTVCATKVIPVDALWLLRGLLRGLLSQVLVTTTLLPATPTTEAVDDQPTQNAHYASHISLRSVISASRFSVASVICRLISSRSTFDMMSATACWNMARRSARNSR